MKKVIMNQAVFDQYRVGKCVDIKKILQVFPDGVVVTDDYEKNFKTVVKFWDSSDMSMHEIAGAVCGFVIDELCLSSTCICTDGAGAPEQIADMMISITNELSKKG